MLIRAIGTRKNGHEVGFWVRATSSFQRSDNGWLITHEHVSLPVDLASGSAVTNLAPQIAIEDRSMWGVKISPWVLAKLDALVPEAGLRVVEFRADRRRHRELHTRLRESAAAAVA